jgi:hypothetical protein
VKEIHIDGIPPPRDISTDEAEDGEVTTDDVSTDVVDGEDNIESKLLKYGKRAECMSELIRLYRKSKAFDCQEFMEWVDNKKGTIFQFVFCNYLTDGTVKLAKAIEVCKEFVNAETIKWTWQEHLNNLPEFNENLYHSENTSRRFLVR